MKIALVHDYIKEFGGAEQVLLALHEIFPRAPIYTTVYLPEYLGPHIWPFRQMKIKTSFLQYFPFKAKLISPFRLLSPLAFRSFDLSEFDVIIVSQTGAYFPNSVRKNQKLITYAHTPPRYLYGYKTAREWKKNKLFLVLGEIANHFLRIVDYKAAQNVDYFMCNSEEVKARIKKFYRRAATVIYPPVDTNPKSEARKSKQIENSDSKTYNLQPETYYLTGGRLARAKGTDIIIKAFNELEYPLKVFGKGFAGFEEELRHRAKSNIEFVGEVTDKERFDLMAGARAFVFASFDEDFGITPVEAMAAGTPVIAYRSGGVKETVLDGKTGILYDENTPEDLMKAVKKFERINIDPKNCIKQTQKFSKEKFKKEIKEFIMQIVK